VWLQRVKMKGGEERKKTPSSNEDYEGKNTMLGAQSEKKSSFVRKSRAKKKAGGEDLNIKIFQKRRWKSWVSRGSIETHSGEQ